MNSTDRTTLLPLDIITDETRKTIVFFLGLAIQPPIFALGCITNVINIAVFARHGLRDGISISFFALSISDLVALLFLIPESFLLLFSESMPTTSYVDGTSITLLLAYYYAFFYDVSQIYTTFTAVLRCCCVAMPFRFKDTFTRGKTAAMISVLSLACLSLHMPQLCTQGLRENKDPANNLTRLIYWTSSNRDVIYSARNTTGLVLTTLCQLIVCFCLAILASNLRASLQFRNTMMTVSRRNPISEPDMRKVISVNNGTKCKNSLTSNENELVTISAKEIETNVNVAPAVQPRTPSMKERQAVVEPAVQPRTPSMKERQAVVEPAVQPRTPSMKERQAVVEPAVQPRTPSMKERQAVVEPAVQPRTPSMKERQAVVEPAVQPRTPSMKERQAVVEPAVQPRTPSMKERQAVVEPAVQPRTPSMKERQAVVEPAVQPRTPSMKERQAVVEPAVQPRTPSMKERQAVVEPAVQPRTPSMKERQAVVEPAVQPRTPSMKERQAVVEPAVQPRTPSMKERQAVVEPAVQPRTPSMKEWQAVVATALVSAMFVLGNTPKVILCYTALFIPELNVASGYQNSYIVVSGFRLTAQALSASCNIFIYLKFNKRYRSTFMSWFRCQ